MDENKALAYIKRGIPCIETHVCDTDQNKVRKPKTTSNLASKSSSFKQSDNNRQYVNNCHYNI